MPTYTGRGGLATPVSIANGGTNATTFTTTNGVVKYDGTRLVTGLLSDDGTNVTLASGQHRGPGGSASAPTYSFTSQTNSGMFINGSGEVVLSSGGTTVGFEVAAWRPSSADNTLALGAVTARWSSAYLGTSLLVNTTAASALHADVTGVTTPAIAAVFSGATGSAALIANAANASGANLDFFKTRSATGSDADTPVASSDVVMHLPSYAADRGGTYREVARVQALVDTQHAADADNISGRIGFWTRNDGAAAALTERARVTKDGLLQAIMGTGTSYSNMVGVANVNTTAQATTGTSKETLATYSLPANSLSANGKAVRIRAWFTLAANGNSKTVGIDFGGTTIASLTSTQNGSSQLAEAVIVRTGAATQEAHGIVFANAANGNTQSEPGETLSGAVSINVFATTATSAGDATFQGMTVEFLN